MAHPMITLMAPMTPEQAMKLLPAELVEGILKSRDSDTLFLKIEVPASIFRDRSRRQVMMLTGMHAAALKALLPDWQSPICMLLGDYGENGADFMLYRNAEDKEELQRALMAAKNKNKPKCK